MPTPRGELTRVLFTQLRRHPATAAPGRDRLVGEADDEDLQLALYCMYELHYRGFRDVHPDWEWEPTLLAVRRAVERRFEEELRDTVGPVAVRPEAVAAELWRLASAGDGPSLSEWVLDRATLDHVTEFFKHRSAYQLKEADPHTWGIPHLAGEAKAVLTSIQADEYGNGTVDDMHSSLFACTMDAVGLDTTPNAYLDELPATTLATTNLVTMLGLHRRLRGALVGHLALFEMTSTGPMGRYSQALARLGLPAAARRFFDVHVLADEVHQHLAVDGMVGGLMSSEPHLASDVVRGARMLTLVERRFSGSLLAAWTEDRTSLREPATGVIATSSAA